MTHFDAIVLGLGGMGSAALDHLARRGLRVLGLEQFPLVHDRGSSHGHTRIIREAYYEHPDYVPLVRRAYANWYDLEQRLGRHLLTQVPCLTLAPPHSELITGVCSTAAQYGMAIEHLNSEEVKKRYPLFQIPESFVGVVERNAGFLYVEDCVRAHLDSARKTEQVEIRSEEPVVNWMPTRSGVEVRTVRSTYSASKLILTAGAWTSRLLNQLRIPLTVMRQTLLWFSATKPDQFRRDRFPIYLIDTPAGMYYGLPSIDGRGHKVARHYGAPELTDPDGINWQVTDTDEQPVREFLNEFLPDSCGPRTAGQVCMYTLTPDRHFAIDLHPEYSQVALACGFSGHGFKFSSAVGEVLADLAMGGTSPLPLNRFRLARFSG